MSYRYGQRPPSRWELEQDAKRLKRFRESDRRYQDMLRENYVRDPDKKGCTFDEYVLKHMRRNEGR